MKENTLIVLLMLVCSFAPFSTHAQTSEVDIVTMKDGKVLKGKILRYTPGQSLLLETSDGQQVEVSDAEVSKIQQGANRDEQPATGETGSKTNEVPMAETRGLYAVSSVAFAAGNNDAEGLSLGAGFGQVVGYQFSNLLGLGLGIGIDNYSRRGETVYPIFGELRSFLPFNGKTGKFYLSAGGGYSLAFPRNCLEITLAEGGPIGMLAAGIRVPTAEGVDIHFDLGAKFQKARFERTLFDGDVEKRDINFRRIMIRIGIGLWKK